MSSTINLTSVSGLIKELDITHKRMGDLCMDKANMCGTIGALLAENEELKQQIDSLKGEIEMLRGLQHCLDAKKRLSTVAPGAVEVSTVAPGNVEVSTDAPGTVEVSTVAPGTVEVSTVAPGTVEVSTDASEAVEVPTNAPGNVEVSTDAPEQVSTDASEAVEVSTDAPGTVEVSTDASEAVEVSTAASEACDWCDLQVGDSDTEYVAMLSNSYERTDVTKNPVYVENSDCKMIEKENGTYWYSCGYNQLVHNIRTPWKFYNKSNRLYIVAYDYKGYINEHFPVGSRDLLGYGKRLHEAHLQRLVDMKNSYDSLSEMKVKFRTVMAEHLLVDYGKLKGEIQLWEEGYIVGQAASVALMEYSSKKIYDAESALEYEAIKNALERADVILRKYDQKPCFFSKAEAYESKQEHENKKYKSFQIHAKNTELKRFVKSCKKD
jgi:hypothetical protein